MRYRVRWQSVVLLQQYTHMKRHICFQMKQQLLVLRQSLLAYLTAGPRMVQSAARPAEEDQPWCPPICSAGSTCMLECCHRLHVLHWVQVDVSVYPVTLSTASSSFSSLSSSSSPSPSPAWNSAQLSNALWPGQLQDGAPWGTAAVGVYCCWSVSVEQMTMHPDTHTETETHKSTALCFSLSLSAHCSQPQPSYSRIIMLGPLIVVLLIIITTTDDYNHVISYPWIMMKTSML